MKRRFMPSSVLAASLALALALVAGPGDTWAQAPTKKPPTKKQPAQKPAQQPPAASPSGDAEPEMTFDEDESKKPAAQQPPAEPEPEPEGAEAEGKVQLGSDPTSDAASRKTELGENRVSWQDIVVVVRKPFLKQRRLEILPTWGITMNDNIIRHYQFNAAINYFLTDVLAIGIEGQYYIKDLREPYDLVARQARRLPTVNKYNYGAALNFHYVPIYGKFAILDEHIIHWETFFTAGVGFTQSEVIPRDPAYEPFKNFLITPNVGASMRFFVTKWLTVNAGIRDYIFVDQFEAVGRTEVRADDAKQNADSSLINNVVFQAGIAFWFPMSFDYTTFR
ncbi:MAG TPA: outer membrane beta-barrel domain-containing protein [Kofleriaceae bacterium]|nr:outer membrane beta-barrel domain-containing protein [Kofleriaceae bacterium]